MTLSPNRLDTCSWKKLYFNRYITKRLQSCAHMYTCINDIFTRYINLLRMLYNIYLTPTFTNHRQKWLCSVPKLGQRWADSGPPRPTSGTLSFFGPPYIFCIHYDTASLGQRFQIFFDCISCTKLGWYFVIRCTKSCFVRFDLYCIEDEFTTA